MKLNLWLLLLLAGCAQFQAVEMPDDVARSCEVACTAALLDVSRDKVVDVRGMLIGCENCPPPVLVRF